MSTEKRVMVDARGAFCPGPLLELMKASKVAKSGTVLELLTNEQGSRKDVPAWAQKMGHKFIGEEPAEGNAYKLIVRLK